MISKPAKIYPRKDTSLPTYSKRARIAFFSTPDTENTRLKLMLWLADAPEDTEDRPWNVNNQKGYRPWPFKDRPDLIPEGYTSIVMAKDPVQRLFEVWSDHVNRGKFKKAGELETVKAAGLKPNPTFEEFVTRFDDYRDKTSILKDRWQPVSVYYGPDIGRFDRIFKPHEFNEAVDFVAESAGMERELTYPPVPPAEDVIPIDEAILPKLREITADEYKFYKGFYTFEESALVKEAVSVEAKASEPLPEVTRVVEKTPVENLTVTTMLKEHPDLVRRFVSYYKDLGFSRINMYFDDPEDPMIEELKGDPVVVSHPMDEKFWEGRVRRNALEARQTICFMDAYKRQKDGWMFFCDADEFLWPRGSMRDFLKTVPADQALVRARSCEPVWRSGSDINTLFSADLVRRPFYNGAWRQIGDKLYGGEGKEFFKWGLLSHIVGKYMVRCGEEINRFGTHKAFFRDGRYRHVTELPGAASMYLIHYDAMSFPHWAGKLDRRLVKGHSYAGQTDQRILQVKAYAKAKKQGETEKLFRRLYTLGEEEVRLQGFYGKLFELKAF